MEIGEGRKERRGLKKDGILMGGNGEKRGECPVGKEDSEKKGNGVMFLRKKKKSDGVWLMISLLFFEKSRENKGGRREEKKERKVKCNR
ncbi:hypothetical protein M5689_007532 [Euphorbia peplus]|nr:hypothetical protein M5689_007532 [Euphorbia peplus]